MKKIAIIGGGISGLAVLHYLKRIHGNNIDATLYERNKFTGGCIGSIETQQFFFETGPNGFLTNQPNTLKFIEELGFSDQLIKSNAQAKRRYIQIDNALHQLPSDPLKFIQTPLISWQDKLRLIRGIFRKGISKNQSVHDYVTARFGQGIADRLVDPFLTGIYAGNIKRLHMEYAFPKLGAPKVKGQKKEKTELCSFKKGMGSLIQHISLLYKPYIKTESEIQDISQLKADQIICCVPAYIAAELLNINILEHIQYAPVAVVGLLFKKDAFRNQPDGFGYLVPSNQDKEILGVLLESNVFIRNDSNDHIFIRVMLGGSHHPGIINDDSQSFVSKAIRELDMVYGLNLLPESAQAKLWPKAIPQYEMSYPAIRQKINEELHSRPHIRLCANYLDGISFNDCILNALNLAQDI